MIPSLPFAKNHFNLMLVKDEREFIPNELV